MDFVVPSGEGTFAFVEAKATRTVRPELARNLTSLGAAAGRRRSASWVVHRGAGAGVDSHAVAPGVQAVSLPELLERLT